MSNSYKNEPMVHIGDKKYPYSEAIKMGLISDSDNGPKDDYENVGPSIEIICDDETRSFRIEIDDKVGVDIPKSIMVDMFNLSGYTGLKKEIEENGVDEDVLLEIARKMDLIK